MTRSCARGRWRTERGYLMVALLVAMSVMAIMMGAALPAWHTMVQREKEAELVFRLEQYATAIYRYGKQPTSLNRPAPSIDFLVENKFLRRKYKDPITGGDFQPVPGSVQAPGGRGNLTGIIGVVSKSTEKSLRLMEGRDTYNQWTVNTVTMKQRIEARGGAAGVINDPSGRGGVDGRGGRGGVSAPGRGPSPTAPRGQQAPMFPGIGSPNQGGRGRSN
jgi:type II secretory pathway pseudopilin PulG